MRIGNAIRIVTVLSGFMLLNACTSCGDTTKEGANSNDANSVNVVTPQEAVNGGPAGNINSNGNAMPYPGMEDGKNPTLDNSKVTVIDTSNINMSPPSVQMPDDSEVTAVGNKDGSFVETRRFLKHKQLAKIEKTTRGKVQTLKVFLRNGKTIDVPIEKLRDYNTAAAVTILTAAGIQQDATARPGVEKKGNSPERKPVEQKQ